MRVRRKPPQADPRRPNLVALQGGRGAAGDGNGAALAATGGSGPGGPRPKLKFKWLRLMLIVGGLAILAGISTLFGMMMAVASDLPEIDVLNVPQRTSQIVDRDGKPLGDLTSNENRVLVRSEQIAPTMKHAVVAIEDRRFYTNSGVDLRGIGRAFVQNVLAGGSVQGGSTIPQQLVKNRLEAAGKRTVFEKMREAAMAFHVTRKWDKERILRNYLNTIYFGYGAYGIESASRTYFGRVFGIGSGDPVCGSAPGLKRCAALLQPAQSALIAGVIANPTAFDPVAHPGTSKRRRDLVLLRMREQGYITQVQYEEGRATPLPTQRDIRPPVESSRFPYFTTWVRQQVVDRVGAGKAFEGGLKVRTTIDSDLQEAAESAITNYLGSSPGRGGVPSAALVALDNRTSDVLAMVGGSPDDQDGFAQRPFNLATQGQRQPGSSFKPFILAQALEDGVSPSQTFTSAKKEFCVTKTKRGGCSEKFVVNNYDDNYSGVTTLANATAFSDNSVFAQLGLQVGTKRVARLARRMGVRSPVSSNYAMTLGGLSRGISPLDMAHAYETFATGGKLTYGTMSPGYESFDDRGEKGTAPGPVGIRSILQPRGEDADRFVTSRMLNGRKASNRRRDHRVIPAATAGTVQDLLEGVVKIGSGKRAAVGGTMVAGKTGTTENYGDAWFVGWTPDITVAVWVGYPDGVKSMEPPTFSFQGEPVAGGTYPAAIWSRFVTSALALNPAEPKGGTDGKADPAATQTVVPSTTAPPASTATAAPTTAPVQPAPTTAPAAPQTGGGGTTTPPTTPGAGGGTGGGTAAPPGAAAAPPG